MQRYPLRLHRIYGPTYRIGSTSNPTAEAVVHEPNHLRHSTIRSSRPVRGVTRVCTVAAPALAAIVATAFHVTVATKPDRAQARGGSRTDTATVIQLGPAAIFAPGEISGPGNDGTPTFSPDGKTIFFTRGGTNWETILESHRTGDHWTAPTLAPFSGEWSDQHPVLSRDGTYLIFISTRPALPTAGSPGSPGHTAALWRVDRLGAGWGLPARLPSTVNVTPRMFRPTIASNGDLFFMVGEVGKKFRIYSARYQSGTYLQAEPLPFSDGTANDVDPEIAPDESFLLFSSDGRRPGDTNHEHLYIVYRSREGAWGPIHPVRYADDDANGSSNDNESRLSPDLSTLYFASDRTVPLHHPATREEIGRALSRLTWDNGNTNVWMLPASALRGGAPR